MKIQEYQDGARATAIYPGQLIYPALGLCGEVGELMEAVIHESSTNVKKEIGDVLWYVANEAADADLTMEKVVGRKTFKFKNKGCCLFAEEIVEQCVIHAGKVAENVKKTVRDNAGELTDKRRDNIRSSLKQIVQLLHLLCNTIGDFTLEECAIANNEKLRSRQERGKLSGDGNDR